MILSFHQNMTGINRFVWKRSFLLRVLFYKYDLGLIIANGVASPYHLEFFSELDGNKYVYVESQFSFTVLFHKYALFQRLIIANGVASQALQIWRRKFLFYIDYKLQLNCHWPHLYFVGPLVNYEKHSRISKERKDFVFNRQKIMNDEDNWYLSLFPSLKRNRVFKIFFCRTSIINEYFRVIQSQKINDLNVYLWILG